MKASKLSHFVCNNAIHQSRHHLHRTSSRSIVSLSHLSIPHPQSSSPSSRCNPYITNPKRSFYTFVQQYQRAVTLTFGKLTSIKEPGFRLYLPILQTMYKVDMRTRVHELVPQHIITRDNVSCSVTAVIYYHVTDAEKAVLRVTDVDLGIHQLAQTELRDLLCQHSFNAILENRDQYSKEITSKVEKRSSDWGVLVENVQLKNIDLTNDNMVRAMAKEAEASREKKAAIIRADGEYRSAIKLAQAAKILEEDDIAVELRRLQTLERIAKEKNQTTLLVPMQIFNDASTIEPSTQAPLDLDALEAQLLEQDKAEYDKGGDSLGGAANETNEIEDEDSDK
eukprot:572391_1